MTAPSWLLRLPFEGPPILANQARSRAHWSAQHRAKQMVEQAVFAACRQAKVPRLDRVHVTLTWYAPDRRRRDPDALAPMVKACLDGLVTCDVLADDHAGIVRSVTLIVEPASKPARIELTITRAQEVAA